MTCASSLYEVETIPLFLVNALERLRAHFDHDEFRNGGCGILATALASLCQQYHMACEITLIHRYDPVENTDTLSHVVLGIPDYNLAIDIDGADADCRWVESMMDAEINIYGYNRSEFTYQDIHIAPTSPAPIRHLQRMTEEFQLRTPVMPFYGHVLSVAIGKPEMLAA